MKSIKLLRAVAFASLLAGVAFAAEAKKDAPVESKKAKCCAKAEKDGKTCDHECCVAAAKDGKNCETCGGSGAIEKKK